MNKVLILKTKLKSSFVFNFMNPWNLNLNKNLKFILPLFFFSLKLNI